MGKGTGFLVFMLFFLSYFNAMGKTAATLTLSVGTVHGFPQDTVIVPIDVEIPVQSSYSSVEIQLGGFQGQLEFIEVVTEGTLIGYAGWSVQTNNSDSLLSIAAAGAVNIAGSGELLKLKFKAPDTVQVGLIPITIESALFNTGTIPGQLSNGGVDVLVHGDVNLNNAVENADSELLIDFLVKNDTLTAGQLLAANVSSDSAVSALDASFIFQFVEGLIGVLPHSAVIPASGDIAMQDDQIVPGQVVDVSLDLANASDILGFRGVINYAPEDLRFMEAIWPAESDSFHLAVNSGQPGVVYFAGAAATPLPPGAAALVALRFIVKNNFSKDSTIVELSSLRWNEEAAMTNVASAVLRMLTALHSLETPVPTKFELAQNYPNPFNPSTTIRYALPQASYIKLTVFGLNGRMIASLVDEPQAAGWHKLRWNGSNDQKQKVASGIYFLLMETDGGKFRAAGKMMLIK